MEGVDDRQDIGTGLARPRELYRCAVVVPVVLMAAQNGVRLNAQLGIARQLAGLIGVYNDAVASVGDLKAGVSQPFDFHSFSPFLSRCR